MGLTSGVWAWIVEVVSSSPKPLLQRPRLVMPSRGASVEDIGAMEDRPRPNAAARVVSSVFGAVGLTNRRASKALRGLGRTLDGVAERAESVSRLVHFVGRPPVSLRMDELNQEFAANLAREERAWENDIWNATFFDESIVPPVDEQPTLARRAPLAPRAPPPWWAVAILFFLLGRCRRRVVWIAVVALGLLLSRGTTPTSERPRPAEFGPPARDSGQQSRQTLAWFDFMNNQLWMGGNTEQGGLGEYLASKASQVVEEGLRASSYAASFEVESVHVDFGSRAPRLKRATRLEHPPHFLSEALHDVNGSIAAFVVDVDEWTFSPRADKYFLSADLALTGSMKFAVPHLGIVLDEVTISAAKLVAAVEFTEEYPFVGVAAVTFLAPPTLSAKSKVGASTSDHLFDFEPFAPLVDDEFKRNLPTAPDYYDFDLGKWLTECSTEALDTVVDPPQPTLQVDVPRNDDDGSKAGPGSRRSRRRPGARVADAVEDDQEQKGPLRRFRAWVQRRRQRRIADESPPPPPPKELSAPPSDASSLEQDEAKRRLDDERRKLLDAATAVRRERDNLVKQARTTRQALSDRVVVAFKLQLVHEVMSLGDVLLPNKTPPVEDNHLPPRRRRRQ